MKYLESFIKDYDQEFFNISKINKDIFIKIKKLYQLILNIKKKIKKLLSLVMEGVPL